MKTQAKRYSRLRYLTLSLLLCVLCPLYASAQTGAAEAQQPQRKVGAILKDIRKTESSVNKLFNELNSSDDYDLVCYAFEKTGSKTSQRICEPLFMKKGRNAEAQRFIQGTREGLDKTVPQSDGSLQASLSMQEKIVELRSELVAAASESPEFATLLQQLQTLVNEYTAHDKARDNDPALGFLSRFLQRSSVN